MNLTTAHGPKLANSVERAASVRPDASSSRPITSERVRLAEVSFHALTERACVELITHEAAQGRGGTVVTPNLHIMRLIRRDPEAAELINAADLRTADGMPLIWASWLQGTPLPQRVAGSNLIYSLTRAAAERGLSVYFLGGNPGTAERTAELLSARDPGLRVAGHQCPPVGFDRDPEALARVCEAVRDAQPDIVYVGLGCPKQERLMARLGEDLPRSWRLGVGYSFSFVAGESRRAPRLLQKMGLEWVHRLAQEPRRLGRRYLIEGPPAAFVLLGGALLQRFKRATSRRGKASSA